MNYRFTVLIILSFLGAAVCRAQELWARMGVGGLLPASRSFACLELRHRIAPRYSLALAGEMGAVETNVMPKIAVDLTKRFSVEAAFGWGHRWQKEGCCDHNFHTYVVGITWAKDVAKHWQMFVSPQMYWRSFQGHIGLHRGSLRVCAGMAYSFNIKSRINEHKRRNDRAHKGL